MPVTPLGERARARAFVLPWVAAALVLAWAWLWLVLGRHGIAVHLLLALAFVSMTLWGALRARQDTRRG